MVYLSHFSADVVKKGSEPVLSGYIIGSKLSKNTAVSSSLLASQLKFPHCGLCTLPGKESYALSFLSLEKKKETDELSM